MATKAQIRDKALRKLGVLAFGQTADNDQKVDLESAYDEVYADLDIDGLATWDSNSEVPTEYIFFVVALVAFSRVDEYGVPNDRYQRIAADAGRAKNEIRRLVNPKFSYSPVDIGERDVKQSRY